MYGEYQIQENKHVAVTMKELDSNDHNFLKGYFTPKQTSVIKKRIIESILFTDMAYMKQLR